MDPPDRLTKRLRSQMSALSRALDACAINLLANHDASTAFLDGAYSLLYQFHLNAARLGMQRAQYPLDSLDLDTIARAATDDQMRFLANFANALVSGRYDASPKARTNRTRLYGARLLGTANAAWLRALPDETYARWEYGSARDHCLICTNEVLAGWRPLIDMVRVPGDGTTTCGTGCHCFLRTRAGLTSFRL